jgi:hypothetical protein
LGSHFLFDLFKFDDEFLNLKNKNYLAAIFFSKALDSSLSSVLLSIRLKTKQSSNMLINYKSVLFIPKANLLHFPELSV